ncbi:MAG: ATP-binding protein [Bacteroidales bacterium]|nr:ATP-binding protein [Bacteroidales bacterium]
MNRIRYVEIENFKTFAEKIHIDLGHPAVLIGPNNAGKTSVIQALSLWSRGVKAWYEKKGEPRKKEVRERLSAGINRLNILDVPVSETRFLWNGTRVRKANTPIEMVINVGVEKDGDTKDCRLLFTYRDTEVIYCKPCQETVVDDDLLRFAAGLHFHLLYPMSGIMSGISAETEETPLPDGRINVFLGQGQTAQVLRNICYKVVEQDKERGSSDWKEIASLLKRLFLIEIHQPVFNEMRGSLMMSYQQPGVDTDLDISLAGRGLQQILLILSYLYWHKSSILLVDEPDAHLEILRQKQVYEILNHVAEKNSCQVVIATHSEVILEDAVDTNLTLLLHGEAVNLAKQQDMKHALRSFGIEHYYKAKVLPRILYVEGSSDIEMLRAFAEKLSHPAEEILSGTMNYYYTCNVEPQDSLENRLDRFAGSFGNFKAHFYTIKKYVQEFKGLALFDSDAQYKSDELLEDISVLYWKNYELENYFISPNVLYRYADNQFRGDGDLFKAALGDSFRDVVDDCLLLDVFNNDKKQLEEFHNASAGLRRTLLKSVKMSGFAETVFKKFAEKHKQPVMLNKGEFYKLIEYLEKDEIPDEVTEKLNMLVSCLSVT